MKYLSFLYSIQLISLYLTGAFIIKITKGWFKEQKIGFINQVFSGFTELNAATNFEVSQIKKSKEFLSKLSHYPHNNNAYDTVKIMPINDEIFILMNLLEAIYE